MTPPSSAQRPPPGKTARTIGRPSPVARPAALLAVLRRRYKGPWIEDIVADLKVLDVGNAIVVFGAGMLTAVLPLIILLGVLANERIDDDLSSHIGLNRHGAAIVDL